jgi:UPF0755 protein
VLVAAALFAAWAGRPVVGDGRAVALGVEATDGAGALSDRLAAAGVVSHPRLFTLLLLVARPLVAPEPGAHLLTNDLTPAEVLRRLARLTSRARAKVVIPEGFNRFQIADRLERLRICGADAFARAAAEPAVLARAGIEGPTAEGFLFPATYDLFADTPPDAAVVAFAAQTKKRLVTLQTEQNAAFTALAEKYGWQLREVLTLASIVEKEAVRPEEQPIIASVFYNRLDSPDFKPARSLQSDPTAAYGCLVAPALPSCAGSGEHITPAMLRDFANPYNTYRHPGLTPGPISNPGLGAIRAVLAPATTDFLFFVAAGDGRHTFSRSLEEHDLAMKKPKSR